MNKKTLEYLALGLLLGPITASAAIVTWEMEGTITQVAAGIPNFESVQVGDPYLVRWSFDTGAALVQTRPFPPGTVYLHDPSSIVMSVQVGSNDPIVFTYLFPIVATPNAIVLRDNSSDSVVDGTPVDGITFSLTNAAGTGATSLVFRTFDLDVVQGPGLPANPYPGMEGYPVSFFRHSAGGIGELVGDDVISVRRVVAQVPEPGTLGLLGLGIAGLGFARRRRAA